MKRLTVIIALIMSTISIYCQDITSIVLSLPDNIILGLDAENKDKLVSKTNDTIEVKASSVLGGEIIRKAFTNDYIALQTSEVGTLQMKLLPLVNDSKIICIINTVCGKACDSNISFYTTNWVPLSSSGLFPKPEIDWFIKPDADRKSQDFINAYAALDLVPVKLDISTSETEISASFDIKNYLSDDDYKKMEPYLLSAPHKLVWNKISFK